MQHQDRLTKVYRSLNTDQLAAMTFHYLTDENVLELRRVADAVPLKEYRCHDLAYTKRVDGFMLFAAVWAIDYWRMRTRKAETLEAALTAIRHGEDSGKTDELFNAHEQAEIALLSLDAALLEICATHNIDPADVRKAAMGAEPFKPMREGLTADGEIQAMFQSAFAQLLG